jgi:rod shape-determining protein MreC
MIGRIPALGFRFLALMLLSLVLMGVDHQQNQLERVRSLLGTALYPVRVVVNLPFAVWDWAREASTSRNELQIENSHLRTERLLTQARLQKFRSLEAENARLRAILDAKALVPDQVRIAGIMGVDANPYRHTLIIDKGSDDGVYDGQAMVDSAGVVGQVISADRFSAQAILISDPDHALPVEVNRNGLRTIAVGTGELDRLDLPFLANNADIQEGDLLVTSGLGQAFPAGYPVAVVTKVTKLPQQPFAEVSATPTAALDQVREIMLIWSGARPETQDE